ncbi:benzaldehyde dehydrogenase [Pseudomonas sp. LS1212]|uniref:benzaldehyde dehydrogenase n=1 Tax=Pseudomonas sp. LS1212 TaxID=2972478 RepID=UPI00215CFFCF|nr:benzaldehyde dehydrogenase [Pseudomonas sp. LS1212]UVJ46288.1 benzaldehyde dehydrogenase [Pseudomonas sp. LS1212]
MRALMESERWNHRFYPGEWKTAQGDRLAVTEPATGEVLASIGIARSDDVAAAGMRASQAQTAWAATSFEQRAATLREAARLLAQNAGYFIEWNIRECGSVRFKAEWEVNTCVEQLHMAAAMPMQANGELFPSSVPGRTNVWRRVPLGVVGVISPWNFPLLLSLRSIAPALALGNAVLLKPSEFSSFTGGLLLARLFEMAGVPAGVFQVLPGYADTGVALVRDPRVKMIAFTGSTAVGRSIAEECGRMLKKCSLELGGNNALIVCGDADIEAASSSGAWGAFMHQGQICMQTGRHIVHRSVAQAYSRKLKERAERLVCGNPWTDQVSLGPLINAQQRDRVHGLVTAALDQGASVLTGGRYENLFYRPTVLTDVTPDMSVFKDEIFGPVAPVVIFDEIDEAIALVNSSDYGLAVGIHTRDSMAGYEWAGRLHCGMVHINDQTVNNEFQVPFGGMGASGYGGRYGGPANFDEFTERQWVSLSNSPAQHPF